MRQLVYVGKRQLEWREAAEPVLRSPDDAIVRPLAAARCDGDPVFLQHDYELAIRLGLRCHYIDPIATDLLGPRPFRGPFAVGHECVAEVVSCGEAVTTVHPGQKVVVPWSISCGHCDHCRLGLTSRCLTSTGPTLLAAYGFGPAMGDWGGAVSDLLRVPFADAMLVPIPDGIDPEHLASCSDNIPDGWRCVAPPLERRPGAPVLVVGGGARSIGLYAAGIAVALGADEVMYLDSDPERLAIAERLGARVTEISPRRSAWFRRHAPRSSGRYPIAVDASANTAGLNYAIRSLAPGGICTSVGYYFAKRTPLPLLHMYATGSTLHTGISHPRPDLPRILELIASGRFRPQTVTTLVADWEDAAQAFLEPTTKVVVRRRAATATVRGS